MAVRDNEEIHGLYWTANLLGVSRERTPSRGYIYWAYITAYTLQSPNDDERFTK